MPLSEHSVCYFHKTANVSAFHVVYVVVIYSTVLLHTFHVSSGTELSVIFSLTIFGLADAFLSVIAVAISGKNKEG